jgi:ribosomal protein L37E
MLDRLRQALIGEPGGSSFVECRRCGTSLDDSAATCGCCGSTDVARYDL